MELAFPSADPRLTRLEVAVEVLNRFYWNVSVDHVDGEVRLRAGELLVARFASVEELQVFAAGMALALAVLPEEVVAQIDQLVGE
jgi:hypothetical protein